MITMSLAARVNIAEWLNGQSSVILIRKLGVRTPHSLYIKVVKQSQFIYFFIIIIFLTPAEDH